ncbi:protein NRT1/ PTR FAMILY 8.2-like [Setaria italica]|uniref:protein NRT1/ PTR FAMILY 8.2-like n=1 Tax=Setaria italica TaxID=4555 RepID=UPI000BE53FA4|nr:protein NRT1/ PTR FAMILY 8.2-like [Setaria italica]
MGQQRAKDQDDSLQVPLLKDKKRAGSKAPAVVLGFECLESTGFFGISTNLVVYLEKVLHGSNLASASKVTTWTGTSYLTPIFGAIIADTFLGNYNTILISLVVYLLLEQVAWQLGLPKEDTTDPQELLVALSRHGPGHPAAFDNA